jgi:hypothetical protein
VKVFNGYIIKQDVLFLLIILIVLLTANTNSCKEKRYTIALVFDLEYQSEGDPSALIKYNLNGKSYSGAISSYIKNNVFCKAGDRVFIEYCSENPDLTSLVRDKIVPDSLINVPINGWEKLP